MKRPTSLPGEIRKIFEKVPDLYLILSPDLIILTASDLYLAAISTDREKIVGRNFLELIADNFTQSKTKAFLYLKASFQQVLSTKKPHRMVQQHYQLSMVQQADSDKEDKYWQLINTPVLDEQSEILYIIHKVEDSIDQQKGIEEIIRSHQTIQLILESSNAGMGRWNLQTGTAHWDEKGKAIIGFAREAEARTAQGWLERIHPADREKVIAHAQHCITEAKDFRMEYRVVHDSGEVHHILNTGYFQKDLKGHPSISNGMVQDITHLRQAEQALKESRDLLQAVFDALITHIAVFSSVRNETGEIIDFTYRLANPGLEKFAARNLVGSRYGELYPGARTSGILDKLKKVVETGHSVDFEQFYEGEGIRGWFCIQAVKLGDGLVVSMEDITRRKKAEEEKIINYQILRQAEEVARMGSWESDSTTGQLRWSEGMYRLFGMQSGLEVSPETYLDYVVEDDLPIAEKLVKILRGKPKPFEEYLRIKVKDKILALKIKAGPVKNGPGKSNTMLGVDLDITAIREAEVQVRESQELLQAVFDVSPIGILVGRAVRNQNQQIVDFEFLLVNQQAHHQGNQENIVEKQFLQQYPNLKTDGLFDDYINVVEIGKPLNREIRYFFAGQDKWFSVSAVKLYDGLIITSQDITRRKHLEEEYIQFRLKGQQQLLHAILVAQEEERRRISESLHNGVGQILYATKLNLERVAQLVPQQNEAAQQALQTTEKLLIEAIEQTRKVSHELVPVLLKDFGLVAALDDLCRKYEGVSLHIHCQVEGLFGRLVPYLELGFYRICQELINNLVKHSQATQARILLQKKDNQLLLEVEDNGKGITNTGEKKDGMGLAVIKDRVELLNGSFFITRPSTGIGTLVRIMVPVQLE
ncbi:PAS domain-containing protein [Rhodocytophaga aerolata]|uniref:Oxygen sensor histidine kinase NreB n=1 Tax=Rhodocytophaga aerolata TaxID=455078 RepID=A0ABT8REW8_9BACT|nr:PAS domain-containing protein [Rhodocytophaga aerolata]MDO1450666.1 PAS domain-containing protein [Rhodocytophaga aerolata]